MSRLRCGLMVQGLGGALARPLAGAAATVGITGLTKPVGEPASGKPVALATMFADAARLAQAERHALELLNGQIVLHESAAAELAQPSP
jgi:hypothetical protein